MLTEKQLVTIRDCSFFANLSGRTFWELCESFDVVQFAARQVIFRRGDQSDCLYIVCEGRVLVSIREDGRVFRLAELGPKAALGIIGAVDRGPRTADATALELTELLRIEVDALWECLGGDGALAGPLAELCALNRRMAQRETDLLLSIPDRLVRLLRTSAGPGGLVPYTQPELAEMLGTVRPVVARVLADLRRRGLISTAGRQIRVIDQGGR